MQIRKKKKVASYRHVNDYKIDKLQIVHQESVN